MKSKKSQIVGQIFIFILATVVFVLIVMYGYRAISSLMVKGEQASLVKFQNELTTAVSSIALDYGSVRCLELSVPKKYREFCFVDKNTVKYDSQYNCAIRPRPPWCELSEKSAFIADSIASGAPQNAFFIPPSELSITLPNAHVNLEENQYGFFCTNVAGGKIKLRLEGQGVNGALLTETC